MHGGLELIRILDLFSDPVADLEGELSAANGRGQKHPTVRVVTFYGKDNVVDPAVLRVLIDKHRKIRRDLGISIPVPGSTAEGWTYLAQPIRVGGCLIGPPT